MAVSYEAVLQPRSPVSADDHERLRDEAWERSFPGSPALVHLGAAQMPCPLANVLSGHAMRRDVVEDQSLRDIADQPATASDVLHQAALTVPDGSSAAQFGMKASP